MTLSDLSDINRRILVVLRDIRCGGRRHIADLAGLGLNQVSPALNRLEVMGFIDRPTEPGAGWTISDAGQALFGVLPPVIVSDIEPEPEIDLAAASWIDKLPTSKPEPEPEPEPAPGADPLETGNPDIMAAMEIELALEQVRGKLRAPTIPARAARVYRELLEALPQVLVKVLDPITAVVDMHG